MVELEQSRILSQVEGSTPSLSSIPRAVALKELQRISEGIAKLHEKWTPHPAQIEIGRSLFYEHCKSIMAQCGRNFGKSELMAYSLWRWAWTYPGSENYYFAPFFKQAKEIMWASRRIQTFGPFEWVLSYNNTELRIEFNNGSFIKLDGSDNVDSYRGIKPRGLIIYDEYKDFRSEFHDAFDPNRAAFDAPLFVIGTPPEQGVGEHFRTLADEFKRSPDKRFYCFPSSANPHLSRRWLSDKKTELYAKGEGDVWEREYEARDVKGGKKAIFPMLSKEKNVHPHSELMLKIFKDRRKLEWFAWADPAGASCFAVLFAAINPYTRDIYLLDEIYETDQMKMRVKSIGSELIAKANDLYDLEHFRLGYDEAETWFSNEMLDHFQLHFEPTQKAKTDKTTALSLIKDILMEEKLYISDRCQKLFWEMENYRKDDKDKLVKKNDHLIDNLRYIISAAHYSLNLSDEVNPEKDEMWRGSRIEDDFPGFTEDGEPLDNYDLDYI